MEDNIPITDPNYLLTLTLDKIQHIFRSETSEQIPLLNERLNILHETSRILLDKFDGRFSNCVKEANGSALKMLNIIVSNFPSYRDEALFQDENLQKTLKFYKRAQILIADIWACFEGEGYGLFHDIDLITMFADYRVPQNLVFLGCMKYSENLIKTIQETVLQSQHIFELEIRASSIWSVENYPR